MLFEAHRGVSTDYPENTLAAFRAAADLGYDMVELDPGYTADGVICVLHDGTLNRTCRLADGGEIPQEGLSLSSLSFAEARQYDAGIWRGAQFRGEKIPAFEDVLAFSRTSGVPLKIDNKLFRFPAEMREKLYALVSESGLVPESVGFTAATVEAVREIASRFPRSPIHYDGPVTDESLAAVRASAPGNPLTVWLPLKTPLTTWVTVAYASKELAEKVHAAKATLGIWILHDNDELAAATALGADMIETTGGVKPRR